MPPNQCLPTWGRKAAPRAGCCSTQGENSPRLRKFFGLAQIASCSGSGNSVMEGSTAAHMSPINAQSRYGASEDSSMDYVRDPAARRADSHLKK